MPFSTDPLGHTGLTVAAIFTIEHLVRNYLPSSSRKGRRPAKPVHPEVSGEATRPVVNGKKWNIDYRLVIIGALLPDIIDRPLGLWLVPELFNPSGRLFAHTLMFAALLLVISLPVARFTNSLTPLAFSLASAGHLLLDRMWESPKTLFWPQYGLRFGAAETNLSPSWLHWMHTGIGPELLDGTGALVLLVFAVTLYRRGTLFRWFRTGVG